MDNLENPTQKSELGHTVFVLVSENHRSIELEVYTSYTKAGEACISKILTSNYEYLEEDDKAEIKQLKDKGELSQAIRFYNEIASNCLLFNDLHFFEIIEAEFFKEPYSVQPADQTRQADPSTG